MSLPAGEVLLVREDETGLKEVYTDTDLPSSAATEQFNTFQEALKSVNPK